MQNQISILVISALTLLFCSCGGGELRSIPPKFSDNGKVIDSIKNAYSAEAVEFENWGDGDATDSTLTVCLINSKRLSAQDNDSSVQVFKALASVIRRSLTDNTRYKSYYIIFVKSTRQSGIEYRSHSDGMKVLVEDL
jgi:hypothetical protein